MTKEEFNNFLATHPDKKFCLFNGFYGFSYGIPYNPKIITNERARKILYRYEKLTGINPIENFADINLWYCGSLTFEKKAWWLRLSTFHRMIGFYPDYPLSEMAKPSDR